ncbi:hypothetical protein [Lentzea kentuckyensis]|uniref:hypothetical protein n=1 Tax=Lentzea kentuckyensis TaxID=360086 RepID=UPI001179C1A8|nr:hypothetical protein [Lentzea kentuckyensis]
MAGVPASATQLADAVRAIAEREGINLDRLMAYVDVDGACRHDKALWGPCAECGRPAVPDAVCQEVDAHIDRVSGRVLRDRLTVADVAALRGVSEATVRSYRSRYPEGHPNAFPAPLEGVSGPIVWDARLRPALLAWRSVGRGVGGGRRRAAPAPVAPERVEVPPVVTPRRILITAPCLDWLAGTQRWIDLKDGDRAVTDACDAVFRKMIDAPANAKGAVRITVESADEAAALLMWAGYHEEVAAVNKGDGAQSLGEYNAARAFVDRATKLHNEFREKRA